MTPAQLSERQWADVPKDLPCYDAYGNDPRRRR